MSKIRLGTLEFEGRNEEHDDFGIPNRKLAMEYAVLVYQCGIANVFAVRSLNMADYGREAVRLKQHAYEVCRHFAEGLGAAGVCVRTAHCDQVGDIINARWTEGPGEMFPANKVDVRIN